MNIGRKKKKKKFRGMKTGAFWFIACNLKKSLRLIKYKDKWRRTPMNFKFLSFWRLSLNIYNFRNMNKQK